MATLEKDQALAIIDVQLEQMNLLKNTLSLGDYEHEAKVARSKGGADAPTIHEKLNNVINDLTQYRAKVDKMTIFQIWSLDSREFIFRVTREIPAKYRIDDSLRTIFDFCTNEDRKVKTGIKEKSDSNFREYWNKGKENVAFLNEIGRENISEYELASAFAKRNVARRGK